MSKEEVSRGSGEQPYDSSFKGLVDDVPIALLLFLFDEQIIAVQELKESLLKEGTVEPALRADCVYLITCVRDGRIGQYVVNVEFETAPTNEIEVRLLAYLILLCLRHKKPVKQVLVCPFETANVPTSPHRISYEDEEIFVHHYRVVALCQHHVDELLTSQSVELYALLPTMQGATAERLVGAIQEMKAHYVGQESRLRKHLLWFDTFLRRTTMVSQADKERIRQEMSEYHSILEEGYFVQERMAQSREEGREEGHEAGLAEGLQQAATVVIEARFPALSQQAQEKVGRIKTAESLMILLKGIQTARDEEAVRFLLDLFSAA